MNKRDQLPVFIFGGALLLLILKNMKAWNGILSSFLPSWESFSAKPYWDFKQWSWGYGTRVPGSVNNPAQNPGGSITRQQAIKDAMQHVNADYQYLKPLIKAPLNSNQWAALLSFAYNLGPGNADNLVQNINANNLPALETQWKQYINAGGSPSQNLIDRRAAEWNLYIS